LVDNYFKDKESKNTLYIVFDLVKQSFTEGRFSKSSVYSILNLMSLSYVDNFNVREFEEFLHSPTYSTKEHIVFPINHGFLIKHLTFLFLIHLYISFSNMYIAEKLLEKEVIKILIYLNQDKNKEKQVLEFFKFLKDSLSQVHFYRYFFDRIRERSAHNQGELRDALHEYLLAGFFVDYLIEKKLPKLSVLELKNRLIDTQRSIRAYMIPKGLLELRFQGHFYFI